MKKLLTAVFIFSAVLLAINAQTSKKDDAAKPAAEKTASYKDFFAVNEPKDWKGAADLGSPSIKIYGIKYKLKKPAKNATAVIYADYYAKGNSSTKTSAEFIKKGTTSEIKVIGSSVTGPESSTLAGRKATQFFSSKILFLPPNNPQAVKTKIIERYIVADDKAKEGFYVFRVYADENSYVETNKVFDEMLKTVKLLK